MSGVLKISLKFDATGPLADGGAQHAVDQWVVNTTQALGDEGVAMLRAWPFTGGKAGVGRDSRGRFTHREGASRSRGAFQASLKTVRKSPSQVTVPGANIKGAVWAPWLEGTSQRNQSTGFKGYHLFRATRLALQKAAPQIGQAELDKLLAEIGGE